MLVKICATQSVEQAQMALDAGADIIGVLVGQRHASSDFTDKFQAKKICEFVGGRCSISLVTHLVNANEIIELSNFIGNDIIQLHSNIPESEVEKIHSKLPQIKLARLLHLKQDGSLITDIDKIKFADYYILDSFNLKTNQVGGTGQTYDWNRASEIIKKLDKPAFLAGGLTPDNVQTAIKKANPYGVDVNSGCKLNGVKNAKKVKDFVYNAKHCE